MTSDIDTRIEGLLREEGDIRQLNDGQAVTFDVESDRNGRESATNLVLA